MGALRKSGNKPDEAPPENRGEAKREGGCRAKRRVASRPGAPDGLDSEALRVTQDRDFDQFMRQVKESFGEVTQQDLAELLGVKQPTVSAAKQRGRVPLSWIIRLRRLLGNEQWPAPPPEDDTFPGLLGEFAKKDFARLREHAGKPVRVYGTKCEWPLGRKTPIFPIVGYETHSRHFAGEGILVFRVESPAMYTTLGSCSLVGVDSGDQIPVSGALFAVHVPGEGVIVRRFAHAGNKVLLCADQTSLPPFEMSEKELEKHMVGRCLWAIREL